MIMLAEHDHARHDVEAREGAAEEAAAAHADRDAGEYHGQALY
jgi:hypothetical protein